ncbi:hypothetical protein C8R46DRAFT_486242 [Mycena filopes]|nr:hypothetical protein C8R46DRAFT_486242 [Mycena filopes]
MTVVRSVPSRRSRRLSTQEQTNDNDDWESYEELLYPDSDTERAISPPTLPVVLPTAARASHARQRSSQHIPRPPNAFICFRSDYCVWEKKKVDGQRDHRLVSKDAGVAWRKLPDAVRREYELLAEEKKREHAEMYPDYAYSPGARRGSGGKGKKRKADDDCDYEERAPYSKRRRSRIASQPLRAARSAILPGYSSSNASRTRKRSRVLAAPSASSSPRSETPELSPNPSSESLDSELGTPTNSSGHPTLDDDDFVRTSQIPPLDLYATDDTKELTPDCSMPLSSLMPGFKAETSQQTRDAFIFFNSDGTFAVPPPAPASTDSSPPADDDTGLMPINYAEVQFTNPFSLEFEDLIHVERLH